LPVCVPDMSAAAYGPASCSLLERRERLLVRQHNPVQRTRRAWGPEGHAIVAEIAEIRLTDVAKSQIAQLLAADDSHAQHLDGIASWADAVRRRAPKPKNCTSSTSLWTLPNPRITAEAVMVAVLCSLVDGFGRSRFALTTACIRGLRLFGKPAYLTSRDWVWW
jgi:hypothetical protein